MILESALRQAKIYAERTSEPVYIVVEHYEHDTATQDELDAIYPHLTPIYTVQPDGTVVGA